ncbi:unnamed protein product, partial [Prorocentrum cordatum]
MAVDIDGGADPAWAGALLGYARGAGVRFVRAGWLRGQLRARAAAGAAGWPGLPRLQDLPAAGALVTHEELWRCLQLERQPLVVSHPWLSAVHPDPEGVQLERICGFLDGAEGWVDADGPVRVPDDHPVFLDWCCLPQHDGRHPDIAALQALGPDARRAELLRLAAAGHGAALAPGEQAALAAALQGFHALFGSDHTKVLCLDGAVPKGAANTVPYLRRGWCLLEQLLARRSAGGFACEAVGPGATPEAPVPLTPELFRAALEGLHFGGGVGDREAVALLYERAFAARAAAGELLLRGLRGGGRGAPARGASCAARGTARLRGRLVPGRPGGGAAGRGAPRRRWTPHAGPGRVRPGRPRGRGAGLAPAGRAAARAAGPPRGGRRPRRRRR